jgi:hypothetical protein
VSGQRLPTEVPEKWDPGSQLYNRQRSGPLDPMWVQLPDELKNAWAQAEAYLNAAIRYYGTPGALRAAEPETAVERYERHVEAVEAVITSALEALNGDVHVTVINGPWLRETAERVLAAAETGI